MTPLPKRLNSWNLGRNSVAAERMNGLPERRRRRMRSDPVDSLRPGSSMSLAIETHRLTRDFGDFRAVDGIDLRVEAGTFYGFLGPNGAGKSTTIKLLTGLFAPSKG